MIVTTWNISVSVDGSSVTQYLINSVNINAQVETARTASFTVAMESGPFSHNPIEDVGRRVIIEVQGNRYFTGAIRNAALNLDSRTVTYNCSDDYNDRLDLQAEAMYATNQSIKYSKHVFGEQQEQTGQELLEAYLAQTDQQLTLDAFGEPLYTPILQVSGASVKTFTEDNILMEGNSVSYALYDGQDAFANAVESMNNSFNKTPQGSTQIKTSVGADTKPLNEIIYEVHHRVPVLKQYNVSYTLNDTADVIHEERGALAGVYLPTKAMLEEAIAKTGWHLNGEIIYEDIPPSTTYMVDGNPVVWISSTEQQATLFKTALFTLSYRWVTYLTEIRTKIVRCTESITRYGLNSERRIIPVEGMESVINLEDWKNFKPGVGPNPAGSGYSRIIGRTEEKLIADFDTSFHLEKEYLAITGSTPAAEQAAEIVESIADAEIKREVLGKGNTRAGVNTTTLEFKVTFDDLPNQNVGYRASYETDYWQATGTVSSVDWNFATDGSALASVTLTSVTEAAQRAVRTGSPHPTDSGMDSPVSDGDTTFYATSWVPDGNGGYEPVAAIDSPTRGAASDTPMSDIISVEAVPGNIPTFIRGVDNWGIVGISPTTDLNALPQGFYANSTAATGFTLWGDALTEPDLPSGIIVIDVPNIQGYENTNEETSVSTTVKIVPYEKDILQPGTL